MTQSEFGIFETWVPFESAVEIEEWRAVVGFPRYEVSSLGRFRNKQTGRYLKTHSTDNGYVQIGLLQNGKQRPLSVHRVVALAFLGEPIGNRNEVNHKNKVRADNRLINLEWSTRSNNNKHARTALTQ